MKRLVLAAALAFAGGAFAQNMKYYASDTKLHCVRGDFVLNLKFDGTGDHVSYEWNGTPGDSKVTWTRDRATFDLAGAENGPFYLEFKKSTFYFLDVACTEN